MPARWSSGDFAWSGVSLGEGATGKVFRATECESGEPVAIKARPATLTPALALFYARGSCDEAAAIANEHVGPARVRCRCTA